MISGTITDLSGRTLSGQTPTAFWYSVRHAKPFTIGLNCALGANAMRAASRRALATSPTPSSAPIRMPACPTNSAAMTRRPEFMAAQIESFAREGLVNIVGGCCGSTPDHIRAIAEAVREVHAAARCPRSRR